MRRASVRWAGIILSVGGAAACNAISGVAQFSYDGNGTGAGSSGSSSGSTGSSTGGPACTDATTCPAAPPGPCAMLGVKTCANGVCGVTYTAGPAPSQVYGNCKQNVCDAAGVMTTTNDDGNVFSSGNPCLPYACSMGVLGKNLMQGALCALPSNATGLCEPNPDPASGGSFVCSLCGPGQTALCPNTLPLCMGGTCVAMHCNSGVMDATETDVDCGGQECLPCGTGKVCSTHSDCFSTICTGNVCQAPSCSDGYQNGAETDVDCGGGGCKLCPDGDKCSQPSDCKSGVCKPTSAGMPDRCAAPTCTDGVKNGAETGVDCGGTGDAGSQCPPCAP